MSGAAGIENRCGTLFNGSYAMRVTLVHPYLYLAADALKAASTIQLPKPAVKIYKLTCIKGKSKKYVSGSKPKCPTGYKQVAKVLVK